MTNKEWLATLSAEDFYYEFKKAEEEGRSWTSTTGYVIMWLNERHPEPQSSVDVVRCKECIHRDPEDKKCDSGMSERQGCIFPVDDDYFCKYGERREE